MSIAFLVTIFLLISYAVAFTAIVYCLLHSKFKTSLSHTRPSLKNTK